MTKNSDFNALETQVHFKERGVLVEGPLSNLKPCMLRFRPARKYYNRRKYQMMARSYLSNGDDVEHNIPAAFPGGPTVSSSQLAREAPSFNTLDGQDRSAQHGGYFNRNTAGASQSTQSSYASSQYYDPRSYFSQQTQSATQQSQSSTLGSGFMNDDGLMTQPPVPATQNSVVPPSGGLTQSSATQDMVHTQTMTQDMIQTQAMTQGHS